MRKTLPYIFIAIVSLLFFYRPFDGNADFYHHITAGRQIITTGTFPYTDTLTFTAAGKPWINYAWGGGVILYLLFAYFGPTAISLCTWFVAFITLLLIWTLLTRHPISMRSRVYTLLFIIPLMAVRFPFRPEIFMYPLITGILLIYTVRKQYPILRWTYPVLILIWANVYGSSVFLGIGVIFVLTLSDIVSRKISTRDKKIACIAMILSVLAGFISPNGVKTLFYIQLIPRVASYEGEWAGISNILTLMPAGYLIGMQYGLFIYILTAVGILALCIFTGKRVFQLPFEAALGTALLLPIFAFRQATIAVIFAAPVTALAIDHTVRSRKHNIFLGLLITVIFITQLSANPPRTGKRYNPTDDLIQFLETSKLSGNALHQPQLGSVLSFYRSPHIKTYIDTRDDLFLGSQSQKDLYNAMFDGKPVSEILSAYPITLIVADLVTDSLNYRNLLRSPDWVMVYLSDRYMVLIQKNIAKQYGIRILTGLDPYSPDGAQPGEEPAAMSYYQEELNRHPDSYYNHVIYATLLQEAGNVTDAISVLKSAPVEYGPYSGLFTKELHIALSILYAINGQCSESEHELYSARLSTASLLFAALLRPVPDRMDKGLAWFALYCDHNRKNANVHMQRFLQNPLISAQEKTKTQILFTRSLKE